MPTTMKALRKMRPARGLTLETAPVPAIGPTEVLVRVKAASICGTDLHIYGWDRWSQGRIRPPVTLGHEFCGVVERTGEKVTAVMAGDFVSAEMHINCGHCHQCRLGEAHICQNLRIIGIDEDGAFAEFVKIPAANIWRLDPAIPEHYAAILDPLGNAVHTVLAGAVAGQTVLVTGCGPIGLMAIAVAKACGSSAVFATETNEHRRAMAEKIGRGVRAAARRFGRKDSALPQRSAQVIQPRAFAVCPFPAQRFKMELTSADHSRRSVPSCLKLPRRPRNKALSST